MRTWKRPGVCAFVLLVSFGIVRADVPIFGCADPCTLSDKHGQRSLFLRLDEGETKEVTLDATSAGGARLRVRYPLRYPDVTVENGVATKPWENVYDPYLQIAQFERYDGLIAKGSTLINVKSPKQAARVQLIFGNDYYVTALQIVSLPLAMARTHGSYWTTQYYYWIFFIVAAVLATVYAAFSRVRLWQAVLVYAIAFFVTTCSEKIYHAIVASTRVGDAANTAYAIIVIALCAEGIPAVFCMVMMRQGRCRPVPWAILGLIVAVGFLFLAGSGWFVGVGLLGVASLMRLIGRLF